MQGYNMKGERDKETLVSGLLNVFGDNLISVVLFGSRARGNYSLNSDVDLLIILKRENNVDLSFFRKDYLINFGRSLDFQVLTQKEVIQNFNNFSPLFSTFILGNKVLFDRNRFFYSTFKDFVKRKKKKKIKYCEGGGIWELNRIAQSL